MTNAKLREYLLNEAKFPFVLRGMIDSWPAAAWTPETLSDELGQQTIRFRLGMKSEHDIQWETECSYEEATVAQFIQWTNGQCCHDNPLAGYCPDEYWCYADYKYMAKMFSEKPHLLEAVQWEQFGFAGRQGNDSTFWLGSEGSYTVCHYDTYGCNLVAQLYGRKQWLLFSPADTKALYPTRIPYEESSVFSEVNINSPDLSYHPNYKDALPYRVTLEPGDVLFVPRQWWHFVKSLDTTISVNTWIELESDNESRLQEAITRLLACSLMSDANNSKATQKIWLNPTEVATSFSQNMMYIKQAIAQITTNLHTERVNQHEPTKPTKMAPNVENECFDRSKLHKLKEGVHSTVSGDNTLHTNKRVNVSSAASEGVSSEEYPIISEEFDKKHVIKLVPELVHVTSDEALSPGQSDTTLDISDELIVNSILHPDVINAVCDNLFRKCKIK